MDGIVKRATSCPILRSWFRMGEFFALIFLAVLLATWPLPPWDRLQYGGMALMLLAPFIFFPFSKTLFLAFDLLFRPASGELS